MSTPLIEHANQTNARCPKCSYSLAGLQTDQCPECGTRLTLSITTHGAASVGQIGAWFVIWWCCAFQAVWLAFDLYSASAMLASVNEMAVAAGQPTTSLLRFWTETQFEGGIASASMLTIAIATLLGAAVIVALRRGRIAEPSRFVGRAATIGLCLTLVQSVIRVLDYVVRVQSI